MFEITTSVLLLVSAFSPAAQSQAPKGTVIAYKENSKVEEILPKEHPITLEQYVRNYFKDTPILAEIARCESHFRQFDENGEILRGKVNKGDIGIMQVNKYYHEEDAKELGIDIYTIDGNLEYAKKLYEKYGKNPWSSSSKCWKNSELALNK